MRGSGKYRYLLCSGSGAGRWTGWSQMDKSRVGVYVGVTEHGNVETENRDLFAQPVQLRSSNLVSLSQPRTVINNPANRINLNMGITGPHYCLGAACGTRKCRFDSRRADARWMSATCWPEGFRKASTPLAFLPVFAARGHWLGTKIPRGSHDPLIATDKIVVVRGGCLMVLERLGDALRRGDL